MQATTGSNLWFAPWDEELENSTFKVLTMKPLEIHDGSNYDGPFTLAIYTGLFLDPKLESSKVCIQLQLFYNKELKIELSQISDAL